MSSGRGRAPGKLILCGEHAVVYGHPAIALPLELATDIELARCEGPTRLLGAEPDARLAEALRRALPERGFALTVASDVPIGRGMGSSAALSVALVRAQADLEGASLPHGAVVARALELEAVFHGRPSGVDVEVSARGEPIRFWRGPPARIEPLPLPAGALVALDSGAGADTAEMVAGVAERRPAVDRALDAIGALVQVCTDVLGDPEALGPLLTENHRLLCEVGVSTSRLDELVALACGAGALGAKLSGSGGGGVVLALARDPEPILRAAAHVGVQAWCCVSEDS